MSDAWTEETEGKHSKADESFACNQAKQSGTRVQCFEMLRQLPNQGTALQQLL